MEQSNSTAVLDPMQACEQRRAAARTVIEADATLIHINNPSERPRLVRVFDISMGGIGFHSRKPLEVGDVCHIRLQTSALTVDSNIMISRCHDRPSGYDVGARFIDG